MEVPKPLILSCMLQEHGLEYFQKNVLKNSNESGSGEENGLEGESPPLLPKISPAGVAGIVAMLQGGYDFPKENSNNDEEEETNPEEEQDERIQSESKWNEAQTFMQTLTKACTTTSSTKEGGKKKSIQIIDKSDGKRIGVIVSPPTGNIPVVLAQMRLDRVGLGGKGGKNWSRTNVVTIGDCKDTEFRYLPYLPLWWPKIDPETGKELVKD